MRRFLRNALQGLLAAIVTVLGSIDIANTGERTDTPSRAPSAAQAPTP